jgi:purine-binding chemotaxis protein CheW
MTADQWVVFRLAEHEYALRLESVSEVLRMVAITPLPESPPWLAGVINLRGRVIAVTDLRLRLGLPAPAPGLNTPIIVVEAAGRQMGLIADSVVEVLTNAAEAADLPFSMPGTGPARLALATLRAGDRLITVLDLGSLSVAGERLIAAGADANAE